MFVATNVCYIERVGFPIVYTPIAKDSDVDPVTKGWVLSAFYYGYASSQIPGGWAAAYLGGRHILLLSFLLWSVAAVIMPVSSVSVASMVTARLLIGLSQGFIFPAIHTILAHWIPPHERSRAVSLTMSGMYLGAAAGMQYLPGFVASSGPRMVFNVIALMGLWWSVLWWWYATDPPGGGDLLATRHSGKWIPSASTVDAAIGRSSRMSEHAGNRRVAVLERIEQQPSSMSPVSQPLPRKKTDGNVDEIMLKRTVPERQPSTEIPWSKMLWSLPVWAIVVNNFTFHYVLYVLMNWLPTYFDQVLGVALASVGAAKMVPYFLMFVFNNLGGWAGDYCITRHRMTVTKARKLINSVGFAAAAVMLIAMPVFRTVAGAVSCASVVLGASAFARGGFAVNHMDIAPRYAGVVMGVSNTAGTAAGVVGVSATGFILKMASSMASTNGKLKLEVGESGEETMINSSLWSGDMLGWALAFWSPAVLSVLSALIFCICGTGEKVFD
ncbi:hypothetical protein CBR_g19789 [Chara braunii]|uniref:Major facilitator superfamily (MFS) profile domain-containing protein n=1 Tax=Chara braunii TaxID=69332 RepID=A0A388JU10_CHABU|nr:hypothetical protein CBR_g19789 [Chara braunii]|eukprot:GBG61257.1 hypothetical protein CBR_g19789 [Chara braunii]